MPGQHSFYSRALAEISGCVGVVGEVVPPDTWVCLSCTHKPYSPLLPGHGEVGHWVREVSAFLPSGLTQWESQWAVRAWKGYRPELSLAISLPNFLPHCLPLTFPKLSMMAHLRTHCWLFIPPCISAFPLLIWVHLCFSKGLLTYLWGPSWLNLGAKTLNVLRKLLKQSFTEWELNYIGHFSILLSCSGQG